MDKNLKVDREILFYAFRYALGRMTYSPTAVIDNIKANIDLISTNDIKAYIKEIDECDHYGMEVDERNWLEFRAYLENVLKQR